MRSASLLIAIITLPLYLALCNVPLRGCSRSFHLYSSRIDNNQQQTNVEEELFLLRANRDAKQKEYAMAEILLRQAESKLQNSSIKVASEEQYRLSQIPTPFQGSVPPSAVVLSVTNFRRELNNIFQLFGKKDTSDDVPISEQFVLSNANIWKRERSRPAVNSPLVIKIPYYILCTLLDVLFDGIPISRFYFLETVARMPYFSYITMIHTYETLGWWRRSADAKRIHFAEEFNEYHHLLIWEALGGDKEWRVRFFAQHSAVIYYFGMIVLWLLSPSLAYNFSELIEAHAVDTYTEFAEANKELLQSLPPPIVAREYYEALDMYVFDEFQTAREKGSRRPVIRSLYDAVCAIRDDEAEHVKTMAACQNPEVVLRSPNTEAAIITATVLAGLLAAASTQVDSQEVLDYATAATANLRQAVTDAVNFATDKMAVIGTSAVGTEDIQDVQEGVSQVESVVEEQGPRLVDFVIKVMSKLRP